MRTLIAVFFLSGVLGCATVKPATPLLGGDSDSHGCKASAGYSWCEAKSKCLRPWEEECSSSAIKVSLPKGWSKKPSFATPDSLMSIVRDRPGAEVEIATSHGELDKTLEKLSAEAKDDGVSVFPIFLTSDGSIGLFSFIDYGRMGVRQDGVPVHGMVIVRRLEGWPKDRLIVATGKWTVNGDPTIVNEVVRIVGNIKPQ